MLPIPFYGLKKWAPQLMVDGIFSAILVFSYTFILWIIGYLGEALGSDWNNYYLWFANEINVIVTTILMLKLIGIGLSSIGLGFIANSMISPLVSSLTYLLMFLITTSILITALVTLAPTILSLGILLHSVPFRITRSSGAMLISLVIIFSIGTPLMPRFIDTISPPSILGVSNEGFVFAKIHVYDDNNIGVPYCLYEIYSLNNKLQARYRSDPNGFINASTVETGIPYSMHRVKIDVAGYHYETMIDPKKYPSSRGIVNITIKINNLVVIKPLRYLALMNYNNFSLLYMDDSLAILNINASEATSMIIIGLESDSFSVSIDNVQAEPATTYSYEWGGAKFEAEEYSLSRGNHLVEITYVLSGTAEPVFDEIYYGRDTLGIEMNDLTNLVYPITILIYRLFLGPMIYLSVLFSASLALARLLGGSSSRIARIVVTGL
ncbi:hypothetical protein [Staphylothermus hellenicus]|nr:hypothetical protein [Staphylothermus hellenicus]